jgi:hypothetical protein
VEAAVSADRLERLSQGDRFPVDTDAVERELAGLWREAGHMKDAAVRPVTRACLWNVVVHAEHRVGLCGAARREEARRLVQELPQYLASRTLVLETHADEDGAAPLESWISANCALSDDGSKVVCSEEITIASRGDGDGHLPNLVRALLVPDVPSAVAWVGAPPRRPEVGLDLVRTVDRLVVDLDRAADVDDALDRVEAIAGEASLGVADLGWLALSGLRGFVSELFEPPATDDDWRALDRVEVVAGPDARWTAQLLLAWIASTLQAGDVRPDGDGRWTSDGGLALASLPGGHGIERVRLSGGGRSYEVVREDERRFSVRPHGLPPRVAVAEPRSPARLLAGALRSRRHDPGFMRALDAARGMSR